MDNKELVEKAIAHYGIKGMKWGVRRKRGRGGRVSSDYASSRKILKKKISQMSDDELRRINKRLEAESKLRKADPRLAAEGKRQVGKALSVFGAGLIGGVAGAAATVSAKKIVEGSGKVASKVTPKVVKVVEKVKG